MMFGTLLKYPVGPWSTRSFQNGKQFLTTKATTALRNSNKVSQSSRKWLQRQGKDNYVKKAKAEGSPSRSIFKLEEIVRHIANIQDSKIPKEIKSKFLRKGDIVVDLGVSLLTMVS